MAAGASLDSQMPDALSGWFMIYPILIVGLAAALPTMEHSANRCRHHDAQGQVKSGHAT
jgi:hypothetical protein